MSRTSFFCISKY